MSAFKLRNMFSVKITLTNGTTRSALLSYRNQEFLPFAESIAQLAAKSLGIPVSSVTNQVFIPATAMLPLDCMSEIAVPTQHYRA